MATKEYQKYNYLLLRFCSGICHLPYIFDHKNMRMTLQTSLWRRLLFLFFLLNTGASVVYQVVRLLWVLFLYDGELNLHHLSSHLIFAVADPCFIFWAVVLFVQRPALTAAIFRDATDIVIDDGKSQRNARENYLRTLASSQTGLQLAMVMLFVLLHDSPQFYYSAFPSESRGTGTFLLMFIYEPLSNLFNLSVLFFVLFTQAAFFNTISRRLEKWLQDLSGDNISWEEATIAFRRCRRAQRSVLQFNEGFSDAVFAFKLMCILCAIIGYGFSITFSTHRPLLSFINFFYGAQAVTMFITFYGDGFRIPQFVKLMKDRLQMASMKFQNRAQRQLMRTWLKSIPEVRIKVGAFSHLELASTLIFIEFVTVQTASLLIALNSNRF